MSRHLLTGLLLFMISVLIMVVYVITALVPGALAYPLGISAERLQFILIFIPVVLLMMGFAVAIGYVAYSIVLESREGKKTSREGKVEGDE